MKLLEKLLPMLFSTQALFVMDDLAKGERYRVVFDFTMLMLVAGSMMSTVRLREGE